MTYRRTLHVEAPVEEVFGFFADPGNFRGEGVEGVTFGSARVTEEGVGTHYTWVARIAGLTIEGFDVFTEFVPGERIVDTSSLAVEGTWTYTFAPEGSGTRLTVENQVRSWWRLPLLERLMDVATARTHDPIFDRLKDRLESRTA